MESSKYFIIKHEYFIYKLYVLTYMSLLEIFLEPSIFINTNLDMHCYLFHIHEINYVTHNVYLAYYHWKKVVKNLGYVDTSIQT
jgi:hypothetical protein